MNQTSEFNELIRKRKSWVASSRENNFNFDDILSGLYTDASHFVYEILQNAEDECATSVFFNLFEDRLEIFHNGEDFDFKDVEGITGIGEGTKREDLNKIGKFGVGFKSVYAVTHSPLIQSGEYSFRILDSVIPEPAQRTVSASGTKIVLPFNHPSRTPKELFDLVKMRLQNIGLTSLLFLNHIREIKWECPSGSGHYICDRKNYALYSNVTKVELLSESTVESYLVFAKPLGVDGKDRKVEIAYCLEWDDNGREKIIPASDSRIYAFFATERDTYLRFLVQAPFRTTPARDNIPLQDEVNQSLVQQVAGLVADSIDIIKELGLLNVSFLELLPISEGPKGKSNLYSAVHACVLKKLKTEELLPAADGTFTKANEAMLARGRELIDLLSSEDTALLFGRTKWLDSAITADKTSDLWFYLKNIGVEVVETEDVGKKFTPDLVANKSDAWMIRFYRLLHDVKSLWQSYQGVLRSKPFIRIEDNSHIPLVGQNGALQVFLPTDTSTEYRTVKRTIAQDEECKRFFQDLGMHEPTLLDELKTFIIPRYSGGREKEPDEIYYSDFEKLLAAFQQNRYLKWELELLPFILSRNPATNEYRMMRAKEIYFQLPDLEEYFQAGEKVFFVAPDLYNRFDAEKVNAFLKGVGVAEKLRRVGFECNFSDSARLKMRQQSRWRDGGCTKGEKLNDFTLDGLTDALTHMNARVSVLLWSQLLQNLSGLSTSEIDAFFQGKYSWYYRSERDTYFEADFIRVLREAKWLQAKQGSLYAPIEITCGELSDDYETKSQEARILIEKLRFKPDLEQQFVAQMSEEDREKFQITKEILNSGVSPDELREVLEQRKNQKMSTVEWNPQLPPTGAPININPYQPVSNIPIPPNQPPIPKPPPSPPPPKPIVVAPSPLPTNKKEIGKWGEEYVFEALKQEYQDGSNLELTDFGFKVVSRSNENVEVIWLNKESDTGEGYDIAVQVDGKDAKYIEVKTKQAEAPDFVTMTGTQWESARQYGDAYWLYVVSNAGKDDSKITPIQNPHKLWGEGKLYAHPVNIKL